MGSEMCIRDSCITGNNFFGSSTGGKAQRDDFYPRRSGMWGALLVEVLAVETVWVADEHVRPLTRTTKCAVGYRKVVANQIELRVARLGKKNFVGITDRDFLPGNVQDFSIRLGTHVPRIL